MRATFAAVVVAASLWFAACGDQQVVAPSVVTRPVAGSVVSILDHPQPVNHPDGSVVSILDGPVRR